MKKIFLAFIFLSFLNTSSANIFGFGKKSWTKDDSRSLCNLLLSQKFMNDATKILNVDALIIKPSVIKVLVDGYKNALNSAELVDKSTLDKIHPNFFKNYKNYKQGIQTRIYSLSGSGTPLQAIDAHKLISDFSVWHNANKNKLKIPNGEIANCRKNM